MSMTVPLYGFGHGGGSALNFKVVAYATEELLTAAKPQDNTVGVVTDKKITEYHFSATQPETPVEGEVYFNVGTASPIAFNALKKNTIMVYPVSAKQYVSGAWVDVKCKVYKGGAWADSWNGELYINGNQYEGITGGWVNKTELGYKGSSLWSGFDFDLSGCLGTNISLKKMGTGFASVTTKNKIDMTHFSELLYDPIKISDDEIDAVFVHDVESGDIRHTCVGSSNNGIIDLSGINGEYYVTVGVLSGREVEVGNMRLVTRSVEQ